MVEKVTRMLIKVDLQCCRCYKRIKKILCEFPQIRDQIYDESQNMVLITVVCCSPEKIRQKIICRGGETVQSVEILPDKPKEPEKKKEPEKPKDPEKSKVVVVEKQPDPAPQNPKPQVPVSPPPKVPNPVAGRPPVLAYPIVPLYPMVGVCCPPCYGGYGGGPCYCGRRRPAMCYDGCGRPADECQGGNRGPYLGQGRPVMCEDGCGRPACECQGGNRGRPVMCDDGCGRPACECQGGNRGPCLGQGRPVMCDDGCGRPACECQGGNRGHNVSRCDYFSEENAAACTVM